MPKKTLKQIIAEEYQRCARDPIHFMKKYCKIQHPTRGKILFHLYEFQENILSELKKDSRYHIILKSRQTGISTLTAGYALHKMLFNDDYSVLVIATKQEVAKNLVTKVRVMNSFLPSWLKLETEEDNKLSLKYSNGSQIKATSSAGDAGRSEAVSLLIIDEAAFIDNIDEIWMAAQSTLATGGSAIMLSCVTKDTQIFTNKGLREVSDFIPDNGKVGDYQIEPYNIVGNNGLRCGNMFHNNGIVDTKIIKTKLSEIEGSYNHKLWACKSGKYDWYRLDELSIGDWVNVQYGMEKWGDIDDTSDFKPTVSSKIKSPFSPKKITSDLAYFLGLYISEGSSYISYNNGKIQGGSITITCGDNITKSLIDAGLRYSTSDNLHYTISSKNLIEFMQYLGFDLSKKAHDKYIPNKVLSMSRKNITALLSGIFDGGGYSTSKNGNVGIGLSNKKLIMQIRMLLLNLGIRSNYYSVSKDLMNSYNRFEYEFNYDSHRLELNGHNSKIFYNEIGFRLDRKQKHKLLLNEYLISSPNDVIPFSLDYMHTMFDIFGKGTGVLRNDYELNINPIVNKKTQYKTNHISKGNVTKLFNITKDKLSAEFISDIEKILIPNSEWVCITDIENSKSETFDFSLPDTDDFWAHSVLYNGILGHQTPNGVGNFFHKTWVEAEEGSNGFNTIKIHWSLHPERDEKWKEAELKVLGKKGFAQEHDCLWGESKVTVRDKQTGDIFDISLENLYSIL